MSRDYRMLIGGRWVDGENGSYPITNPGSSREVAEAPECSDGQALEAARAARVALPAWSKTSVTARTSLLKMVTDKIEHHADELSRLIVSETGATAQVANKVQLAMPIERFGRYSQVRADDLVVPLAPSVMPTTPLAPGGLIGGVVHRQPVGVVVAITPYNFPLVSIAGKIAPALAAGCTVVIKPAPQDPLAAIRLVELMDECGFPEGVVNIVTCAESGPAAALCESDDVDMISFTGSTEVGRRIARSAGDGMKRLLLELGGKGAAIVMQDANLDTALTALSSVWAFHAGQVCTAPTRAIVHRSRYDELVSRLQAVGPTLTLGRPEDPNTVVGPVISGVQRDRIFEHIRVGVEQGATALIDGRNVDGAPDGGFYVGPTLLVDCEPQMTPVREEIFGPVISVLPYDDEDEAIEISNGTSYGLYDYVFSENTETAYRVGRHLRTGNVGINTAQRNQDTPFGGFKQSGVGRDGGQFGLHAYTEMQAIVWPS